ncbi:MAG TPA: TonB family protein, partial [Gemmatimonadaceae bacterium]|nr:TonB family protein [Gemmatimonadaceae bacterium]
TGPEDTRFRVPSEKLFTATFPRLRLVDAKPKGVLPLAEYPEEERDDGRDGEVMLRVVVDGSGGAIISTMEVLHATSPAFALSAARALARYHFSPARVGSCAVPQVVEIPFWFSLRP